MDDDDLVRKTLGGDPGGYAELVRRWAGRVVAYCHARAGREDRALDLAEEALLRGFEELPCLADPGRFGPWILEIADRTCRESLDLPTLTSTAPRPAGDQDASLLAEAARLPDECRAALLLFCSERASYRDVANLLGEPTAAVASRLAEARKLLTGQLHLPRPQLP
jgi:RNA polymerase sigma-70 factor (ECF subfamily)